MKIGIDLDGVVKTIIDNATNDSNLTVTDIIIERN